MPAGISRSTTTPLTGQLALNRSSYFPIQMDGAIPVPLPGMLFYLFVPFGDGMRTFYRFGLMTMFAVAVLAGMGVASISQSRGARETAGRRVRPAWLVPIVLVVLVVAEFAAFPLPFGLSRTAAQPLDEWMETGVSNGVMQYPLVRALNGPSLYRSVHHGRPMAYGHGTFYPQDFLAVKDTILARFPAVETLDLLRQWNVSHILVGARSYNEGWGDLPGQDWESVSQEIEATGRLEEILTVREEPLWFDERVSDVIVGNLSVDPITVDEVHVFELR